MVRNWVDPVARASREPLTEGMGADRDPPVPRTLLPPAVPLPAPPPGPVPPEPSAGPRPDRGDRDREVSRKEEVDLSAPVR
jgi:hypothetical protein